MEKAPAEPLLDHAANERANGAESRRLRGGRQPKEHGPENYIIRASFSQERLDYDAQTATVVYKGKDGSRQKSFDAPELAAAPFDDWPAPSADDYLTDPLYPFEM